MVIVRSPPFRSALGNLLDNRSRNETIKRQLKIGMRISYFCSDKNTLVEANIEAVRKKGIDTNIAPKKHSGDLDRYSLKVKDRVGWHSKLGYYLYGVVEKLNPKKALMRLGNGEQWTVSYSLLFLIMDSVSVQDGQLCMRVG